MKYEDEDKDEDEDEERVRPRCWESTIAPLSIGDHLVLVA